MDSDCPDAKNWDRTNLVRMVLDEFSHNYTKLTMLSFLYYFVVKGKLIWAKILPPVGFEPATPTP